MAVAVKQPEDKEDKMKDNKNFGKNARKAMSVMVALCCAVAGIFGAPAVPVYADEIISEAEEDVLTVSEDDTAVSADETETVFEDETETVSEDETETVSADEVISENEVSVSYDAVTEESTGAENGSGTVTFTTANGVTTADISEGADGIEVTAGENGELSVTVSKAGEYTLSGTAVNTFITVAKNLTEGVTLILDGLSVDDTSLSSTSGTDCPVIAVKKSGTVLTIKTAGTNTIRGSSSFAKEAEPIIKAPQSVLNLAGSGTLDISGSLDDAIKAKNGTVNVISGTVNICDEIHGDGIQAENVNIYGGTLNITTVYDNAASGFYTSGSSSTTLNTITENEGTGVKTERINVDTGSHTAIKAGTKAAEYTYKDGTESTTGEASGGLVITGGTINIDTTGAGLKANKVMTNGYTACSNGVYIIGSPDDALHSNNDLTITGGTITIRSSDDGLSAPGNVSITGRGTRVDIQTAYEGIEGQNVIIGTEGSTDGPEVLIDSNDDGINAAHKTVTYTYDSSENEDCDYTKTTIKQSGNTCKIYSGTVSVRIDSANAKRTALRNGSSASSKTISYYADGDGIDCNGTLDIEGGTTYVFGASPDTSNSPLDTDNGFTLGNGATLLGVGCDGMNESTPGYGNAVFMTYGSGSSQGPGGPGGFNGPGGIMTAESETAAGASTVAAGSVFTVKSGDDTLISETLPFAASFLIYSSPSLSSTGSYNVTIGGSQVSVTLGTPGSTGSGQPSQPSTPGDPVNPGGPANPSDPVNPGEPANPSDPVNPVNPTDPVNPGVPSEPSEPSVPQVPETPAEETNDTGITFYKKSDSAKTALSSINLARGKSVVLMPVYTSKDSSIDGKAVRSDITWTSSDESVVKVTANGKLTAVRMSADPVVISAVTTDDSSNIISGSLNVSVFVPASAAVLKKSVKLEAGRSINMASYLVVTPSDADYEVSWKSADETKAVIDEKTGILTAVSKGTVKISATVTSATTEGVVFTRTVSRKIKVIDTLTDAKREKTKLSVNRKKVTLGSNVYYQLYASSSTAVYADITWSISDGAATTIDPVSGMIKTGTVRETVTVTASMDGKSASCTVTVAPVTEEDLTLDSSRYTKITDSGALGLASGKSVLLKGVLTKGVTFANRKLIWASSDTSVATVKNGRVTAKKLENGKTASAVITVYSADNPAVRRSVTITAYAPAK